MTMKFIFMEVEVYPFRVDGQRCDGIDDDETLAGVGVR
jgi:hypothetical protein